MNIEKVIREYSNVWNEALITKNDLPIREYLSKEFKGFWCHSGITEPEQYSRDYDIRSVLKQYDNAHKSFEPLFITERKDGEEVIVTGTETNLINVKPYRA